MPEQEPSSSARDTYERDAAFVNDLLSSDGRARPGDELRCGLGDALRPLHKEVRMVVAASLYGRAVEALNHAENAPKEATYIAPDEYQRRWLETAEQAARLWREACHAV